MDPSKIFTDIVNQSANVEFLNQLTMVKKAHHTKMAVNEIVNTVLRNGVYQEKLPLRATALNWIKSNPGKAALAGGALVGAGSAASNTIGKRIAQETAPGIKNDPVVRALSNPLDMTNAQKINTGVGAAAAIAGGMGINELLNKVPGIRRKPLLKAILAMTGGAALGYAGWRASDNYQKA